MQETQEKSTHEYSFVDELNSLVDEVDWRQLLQNSKQHSQYRFGALDARQLVVRKNFEDEERWLRAK